MRLTQRTCRFKQTLIRRIPENGVSVYRSSIGRMRSSPSSRHRLTTSRGRLSTILHCPAFRIHDTPRRKSKGKHRGRWDPHCRRQRASREAAPWKADTTARPSIGDGMQINHCRTGLCASSGDGMAAKDPSARPREHSEALSRSSAVRGVCNGRDHQGGWTQ